MYFNYLTHLTRPTQIYGNECCALNENHQSRITEAEIKVFKKTANYTLFDHTRDQVILKELKTQPVCGKDQQLQQ